MKRGAFVSALGGTVLAPPALASALDGTSGVTTLAVPPIVDNIAPLIDYLDAEPLLGDAIEPERLAFFRRHVMPGLFAAQDSDVGKLPGDFVERWITLIYPLRNRIAALRDRLLLSAGTYGASFSRRFPNGLPSYTVYLSASGMVFDATAYAKNEYRLIYGVDKLAAEAISAERLALVAHHEMFHLLHVAVNPDFGGPLLTKSVAEVLWFEGLACYASSLLHPTAPVADVISSAVIDPPSIATLLLLRRSLRSRRPNDVARLMGLDRHADSALPFAAGYAAGYGLVRRYCERDAVEPNVAARLPSSAVSDILEREIARWSTSTR